MLNIWENSQYLRQMACQPIYKLHQIHTDYFKNKSMKWWMIQPRQYCSFSLVLHFNVIVSACSLQCSRSGLGTSSISIAEASCRCSILSAIPEVLSRDPQFHKIPRLFVCKVMCESQWAVFAWTGRTVSCIRKRAVMGILLRWPWEYSILWEELWCRQCC